MYSTPKQGSRSSVASQKENLSPCASTERELFDAEGILCLRSKNQILCSVNDYRSNELSRGEGRNTGRKRLHINAVDAEEALNFEARKLLDIVDLGVQKAEELFENRHASNIAYTNFNLGTIFAEGRDNISRDNQSAAQLLMKAANAGLKEAICELGYMFLLGRGVERDAKAAASLFLQAAKQGDATALCNLAALYAEGNGVIKDERLALGLFYRSYDAGNATAALNLGAMYLLGIGTDKCVTEAVNYLYFAAKSDTDTRSSALQLLSEICRTNAEVPRDMHNSLRFLPSGIVQCRRKRPRAVSKLAQR